MRGGRWLHGVRLVALVLTVLALVRFYADTLEIFLVRLAIAAVAWALSAVLVLRERRRALRAEQERREHEGVLAAHESDLDICPPAQDPLEVSHCGHATEAAAEHDMRIIPPEARNSPFIN